MVFKNENVELGTRFYLFVSEDEYKIVSLVKVNDKAGQFMNEETLELETLTEEELDDYTMLSEYETWFVCNIGPKVETTRLVYAHNTSKWYYNQYLVQFLTNQPSVNELFSVYAKLRLAVYKFMTKAVFNKMINYIVNLNNEDSDFELWNIDKNRLWNLYYSEIHKDLIIFTDDCLYDRHKGCGIDMDDVVEEKVKLPDSFIDDIEATFNIYIKAYNVYELDSSVNMNNVNMKYVIIYSLNKDKYYLVIYVSDNSRMAREAQANLQSHMDVVNFMLK